MVKRTGTGLPLAMLAAASAVGVVGCGNGLQVGGPAPKESSVVASPRATPSPQRPSGTAASPSPHTSSIPTTPASPAAPPKPSATQRPHKNPGPPGLPANNPGDEPTGTTSSRSPSADDQNGNQNGNRNRNHTESRDPNHGGGRSASSCTLGDLQIGAKVPAGGGAAGSQYVLIRFSNTSADPCTMYGYSGVSFVGHQNGTQLGKPAERDRSQLPQRVRLASGGTTSELVQVVDAGNFDPQECVPTTADGFRIYPPESYASAYVAFETSACQSKKVTQLRVYPVGTKG